MIKKLQNFWYYYKIHVLVGLTALAMLCYLGLSSLGSIEPDYEIGLVRAIPLPEETVAEWTRALEAHSDDRNGDGNIRVQLHTYYTDLGDDSEAAGYQNYQIIAALDADLVGKKSGIFLLEDVDAFQQATGGLLSEDLGNWENLFLCIRKDASEPYVRLWEQLQK